MRFNDNSRCQILISAVTNVDPATATVALAIDDTEHPCAWDAAATYTDTADRDGVTRRYWTRKAHTTGYFTGPAVSPILQSGATLLGVGIHPTEIRCTIGATIIASPVPPIQVVSP